ncbi:hypothetical protein [Pedococcus bigeumensis]|jgi:hypothetical protein|uniref:hypothetical protein n=1 Tax=Pedococcus bigeumensis TaxID=433644 RepID=UPI002FE84E50
MADPHLGGAQFWVHGHSGRLQTAHLWRTEVIGYYLRLKAEGPNEAWLHYAPPTIVTPHTRLTSVLIEMVTLGGARVDKVHVWAGARQLVLEDDLGLSSDKGEATHLDEEGLDFGRFEIKVNDPPPVRTGVAVSLLIVAKARLDAVAISAVGLSLTTE